LFVLDKNVHIQRLFSHEFKSATGKI